MRNILGGLWNGFGVVAGGEGPVDNSDGEKAVCKYDSF